MTNSVPQRDLVALVADKNMEFALRGILERRLALNLRDFSYDVYTHPEKDPGCLLRSDAFLRPFQSQYAFALVMFDREGCGKETTTRVALQQEVTERVSRAGWQDRCAAVVTDPELEVWVWSDSPEVDAVTGWTGRKPDLREWVFQSGYCEQLGGKPVRPKEALEAALRVVRKPRSSKLFRDLASRVGLGRCTDPAFLHLRQVLSQWFP